jgi:uncharacterized membrane protein YfcA
MSIDLVWPIVLLAMACEYVDSTLGMGYGTTLTPILLLAGFGPTQIVPSVLLSEFLTGVLAGLLHQEFGNVSFARGSRSLRVVLVLTGCSLFGTLIAVLIAVNVPPWALRAYIGVLVLAVGVGILLTMGRTFPFSWSKVVGLGFVAALNKGLSGGGYGPLVTGGQVLSGVGEREAIGITSLAEGAACLVGVVAYAVSGSVVIDWGLAPSLVLGGLLSVPLAAFSVSKIPVRRMRWAIGSAVTALGAFTLVKLVV